MTTCTHPNQRVTNKTTMVEYARDITLKRWTCEDCQNSRYTVTVEGMVAQKDGKQRWDFIKVFSIDI